MVYLSYQTNSNTMNNETHNQDEKTHNKEIKGIRGFLLSGRFIACMYLIFILTIQLTKSDETQTEQSMRAMTDILWLTLFAIFNLVFIINSCNTFKDKIFESLNTNSQDTKSKISFKCKILFALEILLALAFLVTITIKVF